MSTLAAALDARRASAHRSAVRAVEGQVTQALRLAGSWYWPIATLVAAVIAVVQWRVGSLDGSTAQYVLGSARWFGFSLGVIIPLALFRMHLAAGGTRRALAHGAVRGAARVGVVFGLAVAALYAVEQVVWGQLGAEWHRYGYDGRTGVLGFVLNAAGEGLVVTTYFLLGAAVAAGFSRFGPWLGLALCLVLGIPALGADFALYGGLGTVFAERVLGLAGPLPEVAGLLVTAAAGAVVYAVLRALLRDVPVKRPTT